MKARLILSVIVAAALAPQLAQAQGVDRLSIHGYLTQGYAIGNGGVMFGIPEDGTTDYRNAALQFRYGLSSNDFVTLQLSHRALAQSTAQPADENDVEIDWAFYGRRFGNLDVRLGRVAIPAGIYNEIRDVGVLLPFYRAPFNFYFEGEFTSETVDGVVASYLIGADSRWSAEISAFGGEWDMTDDGETGRATGGYGGQAWINTPVDGVRFGGGASRYQAPEVAGGGEWKEWHGSLDVSVPVVTAQAEIRRIVFSDAGDYLTYYGYLGVRPIPQLTLHGMIDFADLSIAMGPMGTVELDVNNEYVVGANYALSPSVVFKAEAHRTVGFQAESPALGPMSPALTVDFFIFSVSTAF